MIRRITAAMLLAIAATPALADEAYVCDQNRIVYVKPGELEHLKKTDACIAGHYGLTVEAAANPVAKSGDAKNSTAKDVKLSTAEDAAKGLQLEREARAATQAKPQRTGAAVKHEAEAKPAPMPVAAAPSDFRNVVILNATPGADRIYRHEK